MIYPVTGWFEVSRLRNGPTALEAQRLLDSVWLACYPRTQQIKFDGVVEFKAEFKELCEKMDLIQKPSGAWNLQSNAILLERARQVLGDCIRSFDLENKDLNQEDLFEIFLTASAYENNK